MYNQFNAVGVPFEPYGQNPGFGQSMMMNMAQPRQMMPGQQLQLPMQQPGMAKAPDPRIFETPNITMNGGIMPTFAAVDNPKSTIKVDPGPSDVEKLSKKNKERAAGKKELATTNSGIVEVVKSKEGNTDIEDPSTIYSYMQTTNLLHDTLNQIDAINGELVKEFDTVRHNRTMKNKYMVLNELSSNIGSLINNRISVIREINSCISKSNEMDYKKYKDIKAAQSAMNDDKYIADIYQAFMQNPANQAVNIQMAQPIDPAIMGSGIVRANVTQNDINSGGPVDVGYLNYLSNLSPEQNMMRYESDPNVKQVVVYDASTGAKFFQVMNIATGEVIPNVPVYDQMFMEDTTLDLKTKVAKNINMNESFPIIVINDNITSQY